MDVVFVPYSVLAEIQSLFAGKNIWTDKMGANVRIGSLEVHAHMNLEISKNTHRNNKFGVCMLVFLRYLTVQQEIQDSCFLDSVYFSFFILFHRNHKRPNNKIH